WVDDTLVVDAWGAHANPFTASGVLPNTLAGRHRIRVDYLPDPAPVIAAVLLQWGAGTPAGVPASALAPRHGNPTSTTAYDSAGVANRVTMTAYQSAANGLLSTQTVDPGAGHLALATTVG